MRVPSKTSQRSLPNCPWHMGDSRLLQFNCQSVSLTAPERSTASFLWPQPGLPLPQCLEFGQRCAYHGSHAIMAIYSISPRRLCHFCARSRQRLQAADRSGRRIPAVSNGPKPVWAGVCPVLVGAMIFLANDCSILWPR